MESRCQSSGFIANRAGTYGIVAVDNSANPTAADGAVYKGLAIATDAGGATFLYATNFRAGTVEVYGADFNPSLSLPAHSPIPTCRTTMRRSTSSSSTASCSSRMPSRTSEARRRGATGHGIVNTFDLSGHMLSRFAQHGHLDSPWGVVQAPASFGDFAGAILIGNFGDGRIHAFDPDTERAGPRHQFRRSDDRDRRTVEPDSRQRESRRRHEYHHLHRWSEPRKGRSLRQSDPVALGTPCGIPCR